MCAYRNRKPRFGTKVKVALHGDTGSREGIIVNLHDQGAQVDLEGTLDEGEIVLFSLIDVEVEAKVAWRRDNQIGLTFETSIPEELVQMFHAEADGWVTH